MNISVEMKLKKETKHTFVYECVEDLSNPMPVCRQVYLDKISLPSPTPRTIRLSVEVLS